MGNGIPHVRNMIQLPSVADPYSFNPAQADFAYGVNETTGHPNGMYGGMPEQSSL